MKIITTLGPNNMSIDMLNKMVKNGLSGVRISFSHINKYDIKDIEEILRVFKEKLTFIGDINCGKIRVSSLFKKEVKVIPNQQVYFCAEEDYEYMKNVINKWLIIPLEIEKGYLYNNKINFLSMKENKMKFIIKASNKGVLKAVVREGGIIRAEKGCNIPQLTRERISLNIKDKANIKIALGLGIDIISLSYMETLEQLEEAKRYILSINKSVKIWSKIESYKGCYNVNNIAKHSDGIIIGRGDLVPEIGLLKVPIIEKNIIDICNNLNKPVIVATNILPSLKLRNEPTINEIEAINLHLEHSCSGFMLSSECSTSKNPINSIIWLNNIIRKYKKDDCYLET